MSVELAPRAAAGAPAVQPTLARPAPASRAAAAGGPLALRLIAFFAFSWVAAAAYATLLTHPPQGRVLALAAVATAAGAALTLSGALRVSPVSAALVRAAVLVLGLGLALVIAGVPVRLLAPQHWGGLDTGVSRGVRGLDSWLWPYRANAPWARSTLLLPLAPALLLASALCFWPSSRRFAQRRLLALGVLVALLVTGLANAPPGAWRVQGVLLTILLFVWFWLPSLAATDASRAGGWLLACLLGALLAAPLLEGGEGWFKTHAVAGSAGAVTFRWEQVYGPIASSRSNTPVLTLASPAPALLHVTSLDRFDGTRFTRSESIPPTRRLDLHPGARAPGSTRHVRIMVANLRSNVLVAGAGVTETVRWPWPYAISTATAADGTLTLAAPLRSGESYLVSSYVPRPRTRQLLDAPQQVPAVYRPYTQFELPPPRPQAGAVPVRTSSGELDAASRRAIEASPYARVFALARGLAQGRRGPYEVARQIESFLRSNYTYTETPPRRRYPLVAFLFQDRRGYCQQFSGAMTLMLRMDGIPARVGVGFRPTLPAGPDGRSVVRASDAHAWVEAYFPRIGWVSFDPTPAGAPIADGPETLPSRSVAPGAHAPTGAGAVKQHAARANGAAHGGSPVGAVLLALAATAGLALALGLAALLVVGARRVGRALDDDALPAIGELGRALDRADWPAVKTGTLTRIAATLREEGRPDAAAYVELLRRARFAPTPADASHASDFEIAEGRAALRRALGRRGGLRTRLRALYALPPAIAGGRPR